MKERMRKVFLCLVLAFVMVFQLGGTAFAAGKVGNTDNGYVVISFEGLTLGQGFYVEPQLYTYDEVSKLLKGKCDKKDLTAANVTNALLTDKNLSVNKKKGNHDMANYLSCIYGIDKGKVTVPQVILNNGGDAKKGNKDKWLGEFDYNDMSGWMITVDNDMIRTGAADCHLDGEEYKDKKYDGTHMIRWMFTLKGYGADLGVSTGWGEDAYFKGADKSRLYKLYAEIKRFDNKFFEDNKAVKQDALKVMETIDATQKTVDSAYESLLKAYKNK